MRRIVLVLATLFSIFTVSAFSQTATCNDGATSYSRHHSGTCSSHGGVGTWLNGSSTSQNVGCGTYRNADGLTTARPCYAYASAVSGSPCASARSESER